MPAIRARLPLLLAALPLLCLPGLAQAEKPAWTPVAELLVGSIGTMDPARMSDVMTRCTGLTMTLAGMASDFSPELSDRYRDEASRFIQNGVLIDSRIEQEATGRKTDMEALSAATIEKVRTAVRGYSDWMDDNIEEEGSYFSKDIEMEINSCQLASRLMAQYSPE